MRDNKSHWAYFWIFAIGQALVVPMMQFYFVLSLWRGDIKQALSAVLVIVVIVAMVIGLYYVQRGLDKLHAKVFGGTQ